MERQFNVKHGAKQRIFTIGDPVYVQTHHSGKWIWTPGIITDKIGNVVHHVATETGTVIAHTNQMQRRNLKDTAGASQDANAHLPPTSSHNNNDGPPPLRRSARLRGLKHN